MQRSAELAQAAKAKIQADKHEALVQSTIAELFPAPGPHDAEVRRMAEDLLVYEEKGDAWLIAQHHTDCANVHIKKRYDIQNALRRNDAARLLKLVAEEKIEMPKIRRQVQYEAEIGWSGSWADFEAWRKTRPVS